MNKKGFTLIELLATIAILLVIMISVIFSASKSGTKAKEKLYNSSVTLIENAAKNYGEDNINVLSLECTYISVDSLIKKNYLQASNNEGVFLDPRDNTSMNDINVCLQYNGEKIIVEMGE